MAGVKNARSVDGAGQWQVVAGAVGEAGNGTGQS